MEVKYNITQGQRKDMAHKIAELIDYDCRYAGMPSKAYNIGDFTLTFDCILQFSDRTDSELVEKVLEGLEAAGYEFEGQEQSDCEDETDASAEEDSEEIENTIESETDAPEPVAEDFAAETEELEPQTEDANESVGAPEPQEQKAETETAAESDTNDDKTQLTITMPKDFFTEGSIDRLRKLTENKAHLFQHAFQTESLEITETEDAVEFPWFTVSQTGDGDAYSVFISKLCEFTNTQKRVNNRQDDSDNEKFSFRCFLIRIGMVGTDYKAARKVLLRNLEGSSAFRHGRPNEKGENTDAVSE